MLDNSLQTGHQKIDHHHEELFQLTSLIDQAIQSGKPDKIEAIIIYLEQYVEEHFAEEETLMQNKQYEGYTLHKQEHDIFKIRVSHLRENFDNKMPLTHQIFIVRQFLDRLIQHIRTIDIHLPQKEKES